MDFPRLSYTEMVHSEKAQDLVDKSAIEIYESELDYLVLLGSENQVQNACVDLKLLAKLPKRGLILTASSEDADFYSRCFYPKHNIPEDPVTGSAHCVLGPFWSDRLEKKTLVGIQGSFRKGEVECEVFPDRVLISGVCKWFMKGHLVI